MKLSTGLRRLLIPRSLITLYYFVKYHAMVSPRAEIELCDNLSFGANATVSSYCKIKAMEGPVHIGIGCFIAGYKEGIRIGDDCLISPNVSIVGVNYNYDDLNRTFREQGLNSKGPLVIGNNVWIGIGAVILDNAQIEDGVIIAPNSVVSGRIATNSIVQGNPAKVIFVRH